MRTSHVSMKLSLAFAAALVLGLTAGRLVPAAHADQGGVKACNIASERGSWGYSSSGSIDGVGPIVGVGIETCDGAGHCAGTDTSTVLGTTVTQGFTTVETINADCSGGSTVTFADGSVVHSKFVIVGDETELDFIGADPGASILGTQKRR